MARDWIAAVGKSVEGLPGGHVLLGGLLQLHEDEQKQQRNAQIDAMFQENKQISTDTLRKVLDVQGSLAEINAILAIIVPILQEQFRSVRQGQTPRAYGEILGEQIQVTQWPLPLKAELMIQELASLYTNIPITGLQDCLIIAGYPEPQVEPINKIKYISVFVNTLKAQDQEHRRAVLEALSQAAPNSRILKFLAEFAAGAR